MQGFDEVRSVGQIRSFVSPVPRAPKRRVRGFNAFAIVPLQVLQERFRPQQDAVVLVLSVRSNQGSHGNRRLVITVMRTGFVNAARHSAPCPRCIEVLFEPMEHQSREAGFRESHERTAP